MTPKVCIVLMEVKAISCCFMWFLQKAAEVDVEKRISEAVSVSATMSVSHTTSAAETTSRFALPVSLLYSALSGPRPHCL